MEFNFLHDNARENKTKLELFVEETDLEIDVLDCFIDNLQYLQDLLNDGAGMEYG